LTNAALVGIDFGKTDFEASLEELSLLAKSAGAHPAVALTGRRSSPDAAMFVGSGKAEELRLACEANDVEIVIFNHALSPAQQRNLERALNRRVIDRTSLILDIFAQRARSHEGKLQVELAQLQYLATRLVRAWTHLERQKGGIGLRGPGETQLEADRRVKIKLEGELPSPLNPPSGCTFHQRCPYAVDRCRKEVPALREVDGRQVSCHRAEEVGEEDGRPMPT